jgi:hypothetical protein
VRFVLVSARLFKKVFNTRFFFGAEMCAGFAFIRHSRDFHSAQEGSGGGTHERVGVLGYVGGATNTSNLVCAKL